MKNKGDIFFVILTFNSDIKKIKKNVDIVGLHPVVLVDNSTDISKRLLLKTHTFGSSVVRLYQHRNMGYAGGMNAGIKYALSHGASWVVLLNDDVELSNEAISEVIESCTSKAPGVYGPFAGYLDKKRWTSILKKYATDQKKPDYISGSFMIIHKNVLDVLKGFYSDFFLYYEDVDFSVEAKKKGFPVEYVTIPNISHEEGSSIKTGSFLHEYYLARNHLLFVERQAPLAIKLREVIRIPKTLYEHKIFFNPGGFQGVLDFMFLRYGEKRIKK